MKYARQNLEGDIALRLFRQIKHPTRAWKRLSAYYAVLSQWALRLQNSPFLTFQMEHIAYPLRDFHGHWVWFFPKDHGHNFIFGKKIFFDIDFFKGRETKKGKPKMRLFSNNSVFFPLELKIRILCSVIKMFPVKFASRFITLECVDS